ncbi:PepSY domain-containing protein [Nocardioides sp. Leaf285]|uniref:PepSY domain-containing protein n=1 Tax=Nocardioides sp. Leaf285 TaxID=1736322 RepID=UPI000A7E1A74|nr:PepSY domain-containing protein [Nocardioides sp. Leaf285]
MTKTVRTTTATLTGRTPGRRLRRSLAVAAVVPLALGLAACGDSDDDNDDVTAPAPTATVTETASASPSTDSSDDASDDASTGGSTGGSGDERALLAAAATAVGSVQGSTLFSIDRDDAGGWEITVVDGQGVENDVVVSADGSSVERGPDVDQDDADDQDDLAERQQLLNDVQVDYRQAVEAARGEVAGGVVEDVDLDLENGAAEWEVQVQNGTTEQTVRIDAVSGDVSGTETDNDDD